MNNSQPQAHSVQDDDSGSDTDPQWNGLVREIPGRLEGLSPELILEHMNSSRKGLQKTTNALVFYTGQPPTHLGTWHSLGGSAYSVTLPRAALPALVSWPGVTRVEKGGK